MSISISLAKLYIYIVTYVYIYVCDYFCESLLLVAFASTSLVRVGVGHVYGLYIHICVSFLIWSYIIKLYTLICLRMSHNIEIILFVNPVHEYVSSCWCCCCCSGAAQSEKHTKENTNNKMRKMYIDAERNNNARYCWNVNTDVFH